jgi:hypothetical protein
MNTKKILIIASIFPYGAYLIYYFWSFFSGLERIGESTQGYFTLISIYLSMALSGAGWTIIFYKALQRRPQCLSTNIIIFFIVFNLLASLMWLGNGLALQELPFKHNLQINKPSNPPFLALVMKCAER